ncbi:MAG: hypothetical protein QOF51_1593 [Chloroflexota bacterium]|jgi:hypothetical protein|nr:hypothetical protein [Chloroflexota bacterium]
MTAPFPPRDEAASATGSTAVHTVRLRRFVGRYALELPGKRTGGYCGPPAEVARELAEAVRQLVAHEPGAEAAVAAAGWGWLHLRDEATGTEHLAVLPLDPAEACWGLYLTPTDPSASTVLVEAPHPQHDLRSELAAVDAYVRLGARALLMAGSHRYANPGALADVTRNPESLFHHVHAALTNQASHVVQLHGFAGAEHPGYPDVFLSNGTPDPHAELTALAGAIRAEGETTAVYDGAHWPALSGYANHQAHHTRGVGGRFYHLELEAAVRADRARTDRIANALAAVLGNS